MQRMLFAGALGAVVLSMGVVRQSSLEQRLESLEFNGRRAPAPDPALQEEVARLETELAALRAELVEAQAGDALTEALDARIAAVGAALGDALQLMTRQEQRLGEVGQHVESLQTAAATQDRLVALERGVEQRWTGLAATVEATALLAQSTQARVERAAPSVEMLWDRTVGPTVQLAGDTTVGSGVLLESRQVADGSYETLVLTCWHVVRDIQADGRAADAAVPVAVYAPDGSKRLTGAHVIAANTDIDACLLRLDETEPVPNGASLPTRARLAAANVFDPIIAVGCPLGNDPIPTLGNVSATHHQVDGHPFWMISAPTYIGNSGGGIFGADDRCLLGLFSKIYTHGALRPVIVPPWGSLRRSSRSTTGWRSATSRPSKSCRPGSCSSCRGAEGASWSAPPRGWRRRSERAIMRA
ncbi:MAG: trypsin-like peptidase domain-containing protein [Planctomycetota bacterium]